MENKPEDPKPEEPKEEKKDDFEEFLDWRFRNPDQPLFLPTGSVRAIITIAIVIFCCILIHEGKVVPEWFSSVVAMSIAYYYGGRSGPAK